MDVSQDALEAFASLFKGRTDARGTMDGGCLKEPVTIQSYQRHLQGDESLGVYPLLDNGTCWFAAVDLDEKDFKKALSIRQELYNAGIPAYISASRKKGYHIYMFSFSPDGPFVAKDIRKILSSVLSHLDIKAEIFPKQDVTSETIPFGNYINLPGFGFVRQFLDTEQHQIPTADAMTKIKGSPAESVARAVRVMPDVKEVTVKPPTGTPRGRPRKKGAPPCIEAILKGVSAGARDEAAFALARHYFDHEYLPEEVLGLLTVWDTRNKPPIGDIKELEAKVNSAKKGYAFGCGSIINNANLESVCVGQDKCKYFQKTEEERKKKGLLKELTFFEDDAHLYEQIQKKGGEPTFCCYEKESGQITYLPQIDLEKFSVVPYRGKAVDEGVLILPEGIEEYGDTLALMGAVKQHILDYVDIPDIMAEMSAWYVLMTWTYDRLPTVPYLRFRGDTGCLIAGTKVVLADGSFVNIETLGERHLQEINVPLRIVGQRGALIAPATKFYKYENEPVRRLRTETGKEITGTYNHPFLVKKEGTPYESEWKELRYLKVGDKLRTATSRTPWEQIVAIEDAGTATVYDVEVPGPHCFVANGLISHNCGKSRALSVIGELCYKPMLVSGAVTPAPIYRVIEMFRGTLIIDEANLNDSSEKGEVVTILNCGFERNRPIIRCTKDGDSWEPSIFPCFGPKLFSTRQGFEDKALESRCITHIMEETDRDDMPYILNNAFHQRQAHFRKQLLLYRLRNWSKIDPGQVDGIDLGHIEPRLKQTGLTFSLSFRDYPEALAHFKDFIKLYNRTLIGERADSDDGKLALAFLRKTQELGRGEVAASDIADFLLNELKMEHYDARKVGRRMTSLGLKTVKQSRIHGYKHYYQYDIAQIKRLIRRYMTEPDEFKDLITNEEVDIDV